MALGIFGQTLKNLRNENRLSLTALSKKAGISRSVISAYETGANFPSHCAVLSIAKALGPELIDIWETERMDRKNAGYWNKRSRTNLLLPEQTLCWKCARACGNGCIWFVEYKPVTGWNAIQTEIKACYRSQTPIYSYIVLECPQYQCGRVGR